MKITELHLLIRGSIVITFVEGISPHSGREAGAGEVKRQRDSSDVRSAEYACPYSSKTGSNSVWRSREHAELHLLGSGSLLICFIAAVDLTNRQGDVCGVRFAAYSA